MKKPDTNNEHRQRINEVQYHIYKYLSMKLTIEDLAKISSYSPYHFQRIFKEITGKSVTNYIKDLRLYCAANLLIFNPTSSITNIAYNCGFKSSATFSNEFKKAYNYSPNEWRKEKHKNHTPKEYELKERKIDFSKIEIKKIPETSIAYMRHMGFDKTIKKGWQKFLYLLEEEFDIKNPTMLAVHHSNPNITALEDYRYIACVDLEGKKIEPKGDIGLCSIKGGLYATIRFQGICEDVLTLYQKMYYQWIPSSEFEALEGSASVLYYKNNYLDPNDEFDIEFRVPVKYK
ncbi:AraC family transcriptional regulator [Arcobacter sp.]|uniref:AraC family transcriptional regulator n=1 Tax=Arcobacter sp. TaxID=1872629 RepID=UPI003D1234F0